jgi:hypothetical protein
MGFRVYDGIDAGHYLSTELDIALTITRQNAQEVLPKTTVDGVRGGSGCFLPPCHIRR